MTDLMIEISRKYCEDCPSGKIFPGEEIARCIKRDWVVCPHQKEIDEINQQEIEIKFH